jgi:nucleolar protein 56
MMYFEELCPKMPCRPSEFLVTESFVFSISFFCLLSVANVSSDKPTDKFGICLAQQVEDRLRFFDTGVAPPKNVDVMHKVIAELQDEDSDDIDEKEMPEILPPPVEEMVVEETKKEKKKKRSSEKKSKRRSSKGSK